MVHDKFCIELFIKLRDTKETERICQTQNISGQDIPRPVPWTMTELHLLVHLQTILCKATYSNSYIHSYTDGGGCHARCRPTHKEQFGVWYLAHGHFGMQTSGTNQWPSDNRKLALPLSHNCPPRYISNMSFRCTLQTSGQNRPVVGQNWY